MVRLALAAALGLAALAPIQCKRDPDPALRQEDTAGDALYALAQKFRAEGQIESARATLKYLVDRYPSSRYAGAARDELAALGGASTSDGGAP